MKFKTDYKENTIYCFGSSDIATLILVGMKEEGLCSEFLNMGKDGSYKAYVIDETYEVPEHYELAYEFRNWLRVYDDDSLVREFQGKNIKVYRSGKMGILIQEIKG